MRQKYSNLLFFNKSGDPFGFTFDTISGKWQGTVYLKEVSTSLYENETIYILQKFIKNSSIVYGKPHQELGGQLSWIISLQTAKEFSLFEIDDPTVLEPEVKKLKTKTLNLINNLNDNVGVELIETTVNSDQALVVDILVKSSTEGEFIDTLIIKDGETIIAEIEIYTEIQGEDDRLTYLLHNIGESLSEFEYSIMRNTDISEPLMDQKIMNQKKKELLLESQNILPYIGSYRGIFAVLKYFGYYDIRLKQYWKNLDDNTLVLKNIGEAKTPGQVKTSNFGLFYDINRITKEFDQDGLPITEPAFLYSNSEIIIKLFGLKEYIKKKNIGGISDIIDIIGESFHFSSFSFKIWVDRNELIKFEDKNQISFEVIRSSKFIDEII